ncbi:MAG: hypothetical protein KatS3mg091_706 [Patescibacteria group bacterium]|nr:MAG: hypothetical protein KatS3mg091_706 [Patescibacteria group bacterium]
MLKKLITLSLLLLFNFYTYLNTAWAVTFDLIAPSGMLQRGQTVTFTININPEGGSLTSTIIGLEYNTEYLEFESAIPGDTFESISTEEISFGRLLISGSNSSPITSSGVYAYVNFKLIAENPGSTELCAFFNPEVTPTPQPTTAPNQPQPTPTPKPPVSGTGDFTSAVTATGAMIGLLSLAGYLLTRKK